ncbi:MAG: nucleoside monophosphate kinase [Nitrospirota bacterium]|nr:nucleoside monophosphate kinase [Nitrospirota bacterium]
MQQPAIKTVILTGRPGSGKGTQAKRLAGDFGWTHFSTGDLFKQLRGGEGPISEKVRESYDAGRLLPDWFATYLFEDTVLKLGNEAGIICEGYPRSEVQAETFDSIMSWLERPYIALDLQVPDEEVTRRMLSRAETEHRPDSATAEQIAVRLGIYHEHTAPVLEYFKKKGTLVTIDGTDTPEGVEISILAALNSSNV